MTVIMTDPHGSTGGLATSIDIKREIQDRSLL